ncbi:MAG: 9-O-acetylesterase [Planctomycetaceae bacterium]|jgi:sialate O-acetylesterase|nr:9-O-acetylesterase [Planctomycetaceae bacterium]
MKNKFVFDFVVVLGIAVTLLFVSDLRADVRLPEIFASDMVLQREMKVPVWGWAEAGEKVTVSFEGQTVATETGNDGRWSVQLEPLKAGGPFTLTVKGKNEVKLENVLVGEVWLCSGQSNMEWTMSRSTEYNDELPKVENPKIRLFQVAKAWNQTTQDKLSASWKLCNAENIPNFSAVGYYFGQKLNADLDIPVGLINSSWGGTRIEPWTPPVGFQALPTLSHIADEVAAKNPETELHKTLVTKTLAEYKNWIETSEKNLAETKMITPPPTFPGQLAPYTNQQQPTVLYNAMIHPFVPLALRGAIWYQGEANMSEGMVYAEKMKALIQGWRTVFNNPDLGFYYVQLAPFVYGGDSTRLAYLWEAQAAVEKSLPKTGMAVINDLVTNIKDIHPPRKKPVGQRLALLALNRTYGKTDIVAASPELEKMEIDGSNVVLHFTNAKELKTRDEKNPDWFEIAGADGVYRKAEASISGVTITLKNNEVEKPYAVRFAWDQTAEPNVQNEAGFQLGAFRAGEIPERGTFDTLVPEGKNFKLLYSFDPTKPVLTDNNQRLVYKTDKSREIVGNIKRVGYFLSLKPKNGNEQFVFVILPPLDPNLAKLGVPTKSSAARFQKQVSDVTVFSNVSGVETGTFADGCNVEFWDSNYAAPNTGSIAGASDQTFDFGDQITPAVSPGYGSMQIHNFAKKQTIFAFNNFSAGNGCDIGIGNNTVSNGNPDWTFSKSAQNYSGGQLMIFVETE